jgi:hypothetical protein
MIFIPFKKEGKEWIHVAKSIIQDSSKAVQRLKEGGCVKCYLTWKLHKAAHTSELKHQPITVASDYVPSKTPYLLRMDAGGASQALDS